MSSCILLVNFLLSLTIMVNILDFSVNGYRAGATSRDSAPQIMGLRDTWSDGAHLSEEGKNIFSYILARLVKKALN